MTMNRKRRDRPKRNLHLQPLGDGVLLVTPDAPADHDSTQHNHVAKLRQLLATGKLFYSPGSAQVLQIAHDPWCGLLGTGPYCNCDPEISIQQVD
jgi:hypothetical protein